MLDSPKTVSLLKQFRDEQKVKVHLCIGGWDRSQGFAEIAATAGSRRLFASGLTDYCRKHDFAGADIDWEHPKDAAESKNYGLLLAEISRSFKPARLQLTAAIAAWQTLTPEGIAAVDAIHVMSYDAPGKHSTLETAQADVRKLVEAGVPAKKIRLGMPFYGRGVTTPIRSKRMPRSLRQNRSQQTRTSPEVYTSTVLRQFERKFASPKIKNLAAS